MQAIDVLLRHRPRSISRWLRARERTIPALARPLIAGPIARSEWHSDLGRRRLSGNARAPRRGTGAPRLHRRVGGALGRLPVATPIVRQAQEAEVGVVAALGRARLSVEVVVPKKRLRPG